MGKQKKNCWKCTGTLSAYWNFCERAELLNSTKVSSGTNVSGVARPEVEKDAHVTSSTSKAPRTSSTQGMPDEVQRQILEQL